MNQFDLPDPPAENPNENWDGDPKCPCCQAVQVPDEGELCPECYAEAVDRHRDANREGIF